MKRPLSTLGLLLALFAVPATAWGAEPSPADVLRLSSTATNQLNAADPHPDEAFFNVKGAPPTIIFIVDTSGSMQELVVQSTSISRNYTNGSCEAEEYDSVITSGGFDPDGSYPPPDDFPELFDEDRFYFKSYNYSNLNVDAVNGLNASTYDKVDNLGSNTRTSIDAACKRFKSTTQENNCKKCLKDKGYYLGHSSGFTTLDVFSGKFLNFYPPKFVTAREVLKNVIKNTERARIGLARFNQSASGGQLVKAPMPQCEQARNPPDSDVWTTSRNALITEVNKLTFSGGTPLAEALYDVGTYFIASDTKFSEYFEGWSRRDTFSPAAVNTENRPICYGCQVSAAILISDGQPSGNGSVPQAIRNMNVTCSGTGCSNRLDDVAAFFNRHDLQEDLGEGSGWDASGMQRMNTYTIGFGIHLPIMESAATAGDGTYQEANDGTSLSTAITSIINDINRRSTTAGSASIASLQAGSETTTLVPRFRPGNDVEPWRGYLYRFGVANELTNGCVPSGNPAEAHEKDVDKDGACNTIAFVDSEQKVVEEDPVSGAFVRADGSAAVPYWEAGTKLVQKDNAVHSPGVKPDDKAAERRNLWTAIPGPSGTMETIRFHPDNADKLMHAMGLKADVRADPVCRQIATSLGLSADLDTLLSDWGETCAETIIRHYRGEASTHTDPNRRDEPREWLLADIFHSSPIVVEPPVLPQSCANFPSQCVASLWVKEGSFAEPGPREAYRNFVQGSFCGTGGNCETRRTIALVGSNGGFLHAFDMGETETDEEDRDLLTGRLPLKNQGTGAELWGFMPPDLLGTLKSGMRSRNFMVDGTAMVREVWVDGAGTSAADGEKQADEFRTVAVVGTGSGGSHFFALDLTQSLVLPSNLDSLVTSGSKPQFLWMWPEPGSPRVADMGQTFSNFYPRPPPIGPVLLEAKSGGFDFKFQEVTDEGAFAEDSVKAEERWIVGLNGGVDATLQRGRGFALVDVWTGKTVWEQFWDPEATDARKDMTHPIPAGLALMDIGSGQLTADVPFDGYFDTLTVGDMGGNLWVGRMHLPGELNEDDQVVNWHIARGFQTERDATNATSRRPITNLTSNALQRETGYMRTFFGTGDRGSLLDPTTGQCSLSNLAACVSMGCNVQVDEWRDLLPVSTYRRTYWNNAVSSTTDAADIDMCVSAGCAQQKVQACVSWCNDSTCSAASGYEDAAGRTACIVEARKACEKGCSDTPEKNNMGLLTVVSISGCAPDSSYTPMVRAIDSSCGERTVTVMVPDPSGGDATTGSKYDASLCTSTVLRNDAALQVSYETSDAGAGVTHRFVGAHVYGGNAIRAFATAEGAMDFDKARLSEEDLTSLGTRGGGSTDVAGAFDDGWYLDYDTVHERTASPAGMAASLTGESLCVVWNSLVPGSESAVCGGAGDQRAHMIQADFITGSATCLQDFAPGQRSKDRTVIAAPPEPTPATVIGAGSVASGFMTTEPGKSPEFIRGFTNSDPLQPVYQLELSNQEHQCRHTAITDACGI